ncbi:C-C motif chemokine 15 [Saccopteryx leptura]|uniref:C-C motif chemokine 15 n=1 Tax=Saccopteryx leptura TaxID=249018 RepID=UPI00339BD0B5
MKTFAAALSFLILAAVLESPAHGAPAHEFQVDEPRMMIQERDLLLEKHEGLHYAVDCCYSYTSRRIPCLFMNDYIETSSGCSKPGAIFITKRGKHICVDPSDVGVQDCMKDIRDMRRK